MTHRSLPLFKYLLPLILLSQFLHSCGLVPEEPVSSSTCVTNCSSSSSSTGVFVDSAVAGVTYTTSSGLSGTTNASGEFSYQPGDTASFSIGDVISSMNRILNKEIKIKYGPRREGDAEYSVSDNTKFLNEFNWSPKMNNLDQILTTSLNWEKTVKKIFN